MKVLILLFTIFISDIAFAELLKPNPTLKPKEVISIQLNALKDNNNPYLNAGIAQTWKFAHPSNKELTGPISKFILMMNSPSYSLMLNHFEHKIYIVKKNDNIAYFFVELIDNKFVKYGFQWIVKKVIDDGIYKNCWMTISVSRPMKLSESI